MGARHGWWLGGAVLLGLACAALGVVGWFAVVGPSVPSARDLPPLPDGLEVVSRTASCGSGSCYRERVARPVDGDTSVLAGLDDHEECRANGLLDRRPLCTGLVVDGDEVRIYVSLGDALGP